MAIMRGIESGLQKAEAFNLIHQINSKKKHPALNCEVTKSVKFSKFEKAQLSFSSARNYYNGKILLF